MVAVCSLGWNAFSTDAPITTCGDDFLGVDPYLYCPLFLAPVNGYNVGGQLIRDQYGEPKEYFNRCFACNSGGVYATSPAYYPY